MSDSREVEIVPQSGQGIVERARPVSPADSLPAGPTRARRLLSVAWLAIVLGVIMEIAQLAVLLFDDLPDGARVAVDLAQKVSWSALVCTGLALGLTSAADARVGGGFSGLLAAPLAFAIARAAHAAAARTLGVEVPGADTALLIGIASIKGLEYGFLGFVLGGLEVREPAEPSRYVGVGVLIGATFGTSIVVLQQLWAPIPPPLLVTAMRAVNEIVFPIGCAVAIYGSRTIGRRWLAA